MPDTDDLFAQISLLHRDKLQLRAELAKSHQELQLWKVQLDLAQKEILRAQAVVDQIDRARADAEEQAHHYRRQLRRLLEEQSVQTAIDEGRRIGFQEGLELGRRATPASEDRLELGRRRTLRRTPAPKERPPKPVPPAPAPPHNPPETVHDHQPPRPIHNAPETVHNTYQDQPPRPIHNAPETVHDTYQVPPDNFIPVIHQGEDGITLPPPHEWINRPPDHHSRSSSRISQFDILGPPPTMTQPERIADEWRAQNPDVVTPTSTKIDVIPRPKSTTSHLSAKFIPPQRPTTTEPTSIRSKSRSSRKQPRQPIPIPSLFYDPPTKQDSQFSLPKQHRQGSPTNTERTAVDHATSEQRSAKNTTPPHAHITRAPSVAPTTQSTATTTITHPKHNIIPGPPIFTLPPLSPIPTLSDLASTRQGTSVGTASDQGQRPPSSRRTQSSEKHSSLASMSKKAGTNHFSAYYQNYPNPTDIVVRNSRVDSSPLRTANVNTYSGVSPAPLDRRLSIFDDM